MARLLNTVRSIWNFDSRDELWTSQLAASSFELLAQMGAELGVYVWNYRWTQAGELDIQSRDNAVIAAPDGETAVSHVLKVFSTEQLHHFYTKDHTYGSMQSVVPRMPNSAHVLQTTYDLGVADMIGFMGSSSEGGVQVQAIASKVLPFTKEQQQYLRFLAAHLSACTRLRQRLRANPETSTASAIFDSDGALLHAKHASDVIVKHRTHLRQYVLRKRQALDGAHDDVKIMATWRPLIDGRYTMLDYFERNGRRLFLLFDNSQKARGLRLSKRQSEVAELAMQGCDNSTIASVLSIAPSTVANHLSIACAKLGFRNRTDLVRCLSPKERVRSVYRVDVDDLLLLQLEKSSDRNGALLTGAEREVAELAARALSNADIATLRGSRPRTVANQLASVYKKLGVESRFQLAAHYDRFSGK